MQTGLTRLDPRKIRAFREHLGLTQKDFGRLIGRYPGSVISGWERGIHQPEPIARRRLVKMAAHRGFGRLYMDRSTNDE